jgi:large subunit ribosomal protein L31
MKKGIHPTFYTDAQVVCACGNTWTTGSTKKTIHTEVCSKCHPFFTGQQQRILDVEGQVDRFYKKLQARQDIVETQKARENAKVSPDRTIVELSIGSRPTESLSKAGIVNVGQFIAKLAEGDDAVLAIEGFGRKSLIDVKKKLRQLGYELPVEAAEPAA